MAREFRFGLAIANGLSDDPVALARQAEQSGFDVAVIGDHIGPEFAPLPTPAAMAAATTTIRLGTMVLNADIRNDGMVAVVDDGVVVVVDGVWSTGWSWWSTGSCSPPSSRRPRHRHLCTRHRSASPPPRARPDAYSP